MARPLDFLRSEAPGRRLAWGAAALGVAALAGATAWMDALSAQRDALVEARAAATPRRAPVTSDPATKGAAKQVESARRIMAELALPWNQLLAGIERATMDGVALLGVDPDTPTRTVRVTGEAKDLETTLRYVDRLAAQSPFADVHLAAFAPRRDDAGGGAGVLFTVVAAWVTR